MHSEVHVSIHYLRCPKCEVHDHVCQHVIRCMKKRVSRILILEALYLEPTQTSSESFCKNGSITDLRLGP